MKTSQQIRQALIQIAERNGRPHYTAMVVRDVLDAFRNNTFHPLKPHVDAETVVINVVDTSNIGQLKEFCAPRGMREILAKLTGYSIRQLCAFTSHETTLKESIWLEISDKFPKALKEYQKVQTQSERIRELTVKYCGVAL
ncbi:hypothetical protein HX127_06180 [Acinetobacter sp. 256-1]|uniref:hypothetical protein n=1 Tax=Acinetobacter sp. 256-1 TaxID=2746721 RepID=UPI00257525CB|nr:hypothetical protein [Acinetobacter sp. 256-1]MDM1757172.1 hypothetical protein [Acinetobacter sp. 256-1]